MTKDKQQPYCSPVIREICITPRASLLGTSIEGFTNTSPSVAEDDEVISFTGF